MHRIKSIIMQLIVLCFTNISLGIVINETIKNTCPNDPTFGGKCHLKEVKSDGASCKTIKGTNICKDWWKKEYIYECEGTDNSVLFNTFLNQKYCRLTTKCKTWEDVSLNGGKVSCRVYLDKNRPGCDSNPNKSECVADDCGDIKKKCQLKEYINYGDLQDKANNSISGTALGTYIYECPSTARKVCKEYETKVKCPAICPDGTKIDCPDNTNQVVCPDGSFAECQESACNTVKTCVEYKNTITEGIEIKSCIAPRKYTEYRVEANSNQAQDLKNNPSCIKVSDKITPCSYSTTTYGDTTICELAGRHSSIGGNSGQVFIGRNIQVPDRTDLVIYIYTGNSCDDDNTRVDAIIKNSQTGQVIGEKHTSCSVNGQVYTLYKNTQNLTIDYKLKIAHCIGSGCGSNDYTFSDTEKSRSWNYGGDTWDSHNSSLGWKVYHWETYRCYDNTIDTSNCSSFSSNCQLQDNLNDLSNLTCNKLIQDIDNPNKKVCAEYIIQYQCPTTITKRECKKYETKQVCNDSVFPIKDVEVENKDFTGDFAQATALAQLANEMKHIWSGKWQRCDSGWFSDAFDNPTEFFKQRLISFAVSQFGAQFFSAATTFVSDYLGSCMALPLTAATQGTYASFQDYQQAQQTMGSCLSDGASQAWADAGNNSAMQDFLTQIGFSPNNPAISFLASPMGQFALQTAVAIIMTTEQCNSCSSKDCAEKHGFYDTYGLLQGGNCHFVESGCAWKIKWPGGKTCLRKKYYYCCYDSVFARILVEQAYKQLGYSFAGGNCSALTWDDLKNLDFSSMDFTELQNYLEAKMKGQIDPNLIKNKINNYFDSDYGNQTFTGETPYTGGK